MTPPRSTPFAILLAAFFATSVSCAAPRPAAERTPPAPATPLAAAPELKPAAKLPPELASAGAGATFRALVDLRDQVDLLALGRQMSKQGLPRLERRRVVVDALRRVAQQGQARVEPLLAELRRRGDVTDVRGFCVVNRLFVEGSAAAFAELAKRPDVGAITLETELVRPVWSSAEPAPAAERSNDEWAVASTRADQAWRRGLDGSGVVLGTIDSGASEIHEQLRDNYLGGQRGWFDPRRRARTPADGALGHGTGVLSCAVGSNVEGAIVGVAPGARWVACAALPEGRYNNVRMTECADWMLQTASPDVIVNAWLSPNEGCDESFRRIVDAWRAAEILPVFTSGNLGPAPGKNRSPANYTKLYPGDAAALAAGGFTPAGELYNLSGTGPGACDPSVPFPSLVAPALNVRTAFPMGASAYRQAEGASYSAGFVAGAAAILLQSDPEASVVELETALREGAADLGATGPDNRFGYGRLDVPGALDALARLRQKKDATNKPADAATHK